MRTAKPEDSNLAVMCRYRNIEYMFQSMTRRIEYELIKTTRSSIDTQVIMECALMYLGLKMAVDTFDGTYVWSASMILVLLMGAQLVPICTH